MSFRSVTLYSPSCRFDIPHETDSTTFLESVCIYQAYKERRLCFPTLEFQLLVEQYHQLQFMASTFLNCKVSGYFRACTCLLCFTERYNVLTTKLSNQGSAINGLVKYFQKLYGKIYRIGQVACPQEECCYPCHDLCDEVSHL